MFLSFCLPYRKKLSVMRRIFIAQRIQDFCGFFPEELERFRDGVVERKKPWAFFDVFNIRALVKRKCFFEDFSVVSLKKGRGVWKNWLLFREDKAFFVKSFSWYRWKRFQWHWNQREHYVLLPEERLFIESYAYRVLSQEGIAPYSLFFANSGFLLREYWEGETLSDFFSHVESKRNFEQIAQKVYEKISAMHSLGVIHGDLSPDNICVCKREGVFDVFFIDFEWAWFNYEYENISLAEMILMDKEKMVQKTQKISPYFGEILDAFFQSSKEPS